MSFRGKGRFGKSVDRIEETLIAIFLGSMTLITFSNVIARYVFNANLLWALEVTLFLFAWLVLLGMCQHIVCVFKKLGFKTGITQRFIEDPTNRRIVVHNPNGC